MYSWLSGDFRFFWNETIVDLIGVPSAWDAILNTGLGRSSLDVLWLNTYLQFSLWFSKLGLSWEIIALIFFILPIISLAFFSAFSLFKFFFPEYKYYAFLAGIIYLVNTYSLLIILGGQVGVSLAYSLAPFVILSFIYSFRYKTFRSGLITSLILSLQVLFDPRLTYITLLGMGIYLFVFVRNFDLRGLFKTIIAPFGVVFLVHTFWILPLFFSASSIITDHFETVDSFKFFSFAKLENTISLLHPNWPENIFGKVGFMKAEFLLLPILAFSSLLFLSKNGYMTKWLNSSKKNAIIQPSHYLAIRFFCLLGLVGAFLAKGANEPFGYVNEFLFEYLPGMKMFRDPTKFYLLIALSYSVLIPFSIYSFYQWFNSKFKIKSSKLQFKIQKYFPFVFFLLLTSYFLFLIHPAVLGRLGGTFKPQVVSGEYVKLKDFLYEQKGFARTLWIPQWQRYGYFSYSHPAVRLEELYNDKKNKSIARWLSSSDTIQELQYAGVKYVIVPFDSEGEIFLKDRKYDERQYREMVKRLQTVTWLKEIDGFDKIKVFEVKNYKEHFYLPNCKLRIANCGLDYKFINPTKYKVSVKNAKKGDLLVFSEEYDKNWSATADVGRKTQDLSRPYNKRFNSFVLPQDGSYELEIFYEPQKWVNVGGLISLVTLILVLGSLIMLRRK